MKVEVLQQDIDAGSPCNEECCPIALALYRMVSDGYEVLENGIVHIKNNGVMVYVCADSVTISAPEGEHDYKLPYVVSNMVYVYDESGIMYPFGFILDGGTFRPHGET